MWRMSVSESSDDPYDQLVFRIANLAHEEGDESRAWWIKQEMDSGEFQIAFFETMEFLVQSDIPVSYDDYKLFESEFSHNDEPDYDPEIDSLVAYDEAEIFKKLKLSDE